MPNRILILSQPVINIGEAFVKKGAKMLLEDVFPEAEIVESSSYSSRLSRWAVGEGSRMRNVVSQGDLVEADIAVVVGCVLWPGAIAEFEQTIRHLSDSGVPVVALGVGGKNYADEAISDTKPRLEDIDALITRDSNAYDAYSDAFELAYDGIDCAFFLNDWYTPVDSNRTFTAVTCDAVEEPELAGENVIRPHHQPATLLHQASTPESVVKLLQRPRQRLPSRISNRIPGLKEWHFNKDVYQELRAGDLFVSEDPREYLFIYANAERVHTDRVHATIPSLVYHTPVKFYRKESPRAALFDGVVDEDGNGFYTLDNEAIENNREEQKEKVAEIFSWVS
jgi:hypothetical protein